MTSSTRTRRPAITASQLVIEAAANAVLPLIPVTDTRISARSPRSTLTTTTRSGAAPQTKQIGRAHV